jgi:hypothetical protein
MSLNEMQLISLPEEAFRHQKGPGYCGVACAKILVQAGLGRELSETEEKEIDRYHNPAAGLTHENFELLLKNYFESVALETEASFDRLVELVEDGYYVVINWWDQRGGEEEADGHYSVVGSIDLENREILLYDPSNEPHPDGRLGIYPMKEAKLDEIWYDKKSDGSICRRWLIAVQKDSFIGRQEVI